MVKKQNMKLHGEFNIRSKYEKNNSCNNAAVNIPGDAIELDEYLWDKTMSVNVKSQFLFLKYVVPFMKKSGKGSIINTASANSYVAEPRLISYVTSKGAIKMLTKSAALDYAKDIF